MKYLLIMFAAIPIITLLVFGIEDKNRDYFEKGKFVTNTEGWQYRYEGVIYHNGAMVDHWTKIIVVSAMFSFIAYIVYEGAYMIKREIQK